jgi:hypothetical protein
VTRDGDTRAFFGILIWRGGEEIPDEEEELLQAQPPLRTGILKKFDPRILDRPQGPDSGLNAVMGKWPGDETDEEVLAMLEELS